MRAREIPPELEGHFPRRASLTGTLLLTVLALAGCGREPESASPPPPSPAAEASAPAAEIFVERAAATGLDFVHFNGMSGEHYYCEHMGGGVALFDYDLDGDLDVYLTQGHMLGPGKTLDDALFPPPEGKPLSDRLYRNDLDRGDDGAPRLRFTDVTEESGLAALGYGMGVAVGDVDNDGRPDLYVTNWGSPNQLWRNLGPDRDGRVRFADVTAATGTGEGRWAVAALFFDYDRDGRLDLYVANYLDYTFAVHKECTNDVGLRDYCGPVSFEPLPDVLFHNRGGRFEDVTATTAFVPEPRPGLGAVSGDYDGNGWLDVYVANDEYPNQLLLNQGAGSGGVRFRDEALLAGAAMNEEGQAEAGMGVGAGDVDNDGDEDLFVSHLNQETNTLYLNDSAGIFDDRTDETGLGSPSFDYTGFGTGFLDYDNDGWLDVFVANGAVQGLRDLLLAGDPYPLHQRNQLFRNTGGGRYREVSAEAGAAFELSEVSRGAAFGDLDNDGDTDVVVANNAGPVRLLVNQVGQDRPWVGLRLVGGEAGRDMLGAWVELLEPGRRQARRVRTEGSYASASDPRVLFGLGDAQGETAPARAARVRVTWPDGAVEEFGDLPLGRYSTLRQGSGQPAK